MTTLKARLALLHNESASAVAAILCEALPAAELDEQEAICRTLLRSRHPSAAASVIQHLHRLGDWACPMLSDASNDLRPAVERIVRQGRRQPILNTLVLIERLTLASCVDLIGSLVESSLKDVGQRTAQVILSVVQATTGPTGQHDPRSVIAQLGRPLVVGVPSS